jgi:glycosyltransferase involved in cell wall biosynthesis
MTEIETTIAVCTYNRADMLAGALDSLAALRTDGRFRYQVVVVDNGSNDHTSRVIESAARRFPVPIRGVREEGHGVACARNRAIAEARTEWIAFFDDDQRAAPDWLKELLKVAQDKQTRCVGGAVHLRLPDSVRGRRPTYDKVLGQGKRPNTPCRYNSRMSPGTGNVLIHRSVLQEVGGFDESLHMAGEDTDLFRRIAAAGIDAWYAPKAIVYHIVLPYRLQGDYLRWKHLREGQDTARRDRQRRGRLALCPIMIIRLGRAISLTIPWLLWAGLVRAKGSALEARCRLWYDEGYIRTALRSMAPRLFSQSNFFSRLEFRAERDLFTGAPRRDSGDEDHALP